MITKKDLETLMSLKRDDWRDVQDGIEIADAHYDELDAIVKKYPELTQTINLLKSRVDARRERRQSKNRQANITDWEELADDVWEKMKASIEGYADLYTNHEKSKIERRADLYLKLSRMDEPEQISWMKANGLRSGGWRKFDNILKKAQKSYWMVKKPSKLKSELERFKDAFMAGERAKLDKLAFRTYDKLDGVYNARIGEYRDDMMKIVVDTNNEKDVEIRLYAISAGGYNIQQYHFRWLTRFTVDGKTMKVKP